MPIITLTSDWGLRDHYLAAVKGALLSRLPEALIVDITHQVAPFSLREASFIIRNSYRNFPEGTIHIIAIRSEETKDFVHTALEYDGHFFIGADNGIFSLIFDSKPDRMVEVNLPQDSGQFTFSTRDRFVEAAVFLAGGEPLEKLGRAKDTWIEQSHFRPVVSGNVIRGMVIYVDNYENVITNITRELFDKVGRGRQFTIEFRREQLSRLAASYQDVPEGEIAALFGSTGHLEIAVNYGNASGLLGLYVDGMVRIEFFGE